MACAATVCLERFKQSWNDFVQDKLAHRSKLRLHTVRLFVFLDDIRKLLAEEDCP